MNAYESLEAEFHGNPFTRRDAIAAGFSDDDLRTRGLTRPFRGVRTHGLPRDLVALARAYAAKIAPGRALTGLSAAAVRGWPIPRRYRDRPLVEVAGPESANRIREPGVSYRRVRDDVWSLTSFDGLPLTAAPLTLLMLARICTSAELVVLGDAAVATSENYRDLRERGSTTIDDLTRAVASYSRCHGARVLAEVVPRIRTGVESRMESLARLAIVDAGLPEPEVGVEIWNGDELVAVGDLVYRDRRVIVEYEGEHHFTDPKQAAKDLKRVRRLNELGWHVFRISVDDLFPSAARFTAELRRTLSRAA